MIFASINDSDLNNFERVGQYFNCVCRIREEVIEIICKYFPNLLFGFFGIFEMGFCDMTQHVGGRY
jgi:hypothetical protein